MTTCVHQLGYWVHLTPPTVITPTAIASDKMMIIRQIQKEDYEGIRQLLVDEGWQHQVKDSARFKSIMERSGCSAVAVEDDGRVIGFARAVQRDEANGYISMVAVAEDKLNVVAKARDERLEMQQSIGYLLFECIREEHPGVKWELRRGISLLRPDKSQTL